MKVPLALSSRHYDIIFGWRNKKDFGSINQKNKIITINVELFVAVMLIHELLHEKYPSLKEEEIIAKAWRSIERMKTKEIKKLAGKLLHLSKKSRQFPYIKEKKRLPAAHIMWVFLF